MYTSNTFSFISDGFPESSLSFPRQFNDLLSKHELTEEQLTLCRDIRRRGKNKVGVVFLDPRVSKIFFDMSVTYLGTDGVVTMMAINFNFFTGGGSKL